MKIGICSDKARWKLISAAGFDYAEANFSKIASLTEEEFSIYMLERDAAGFSIEAYNGFFGSGMCIYGDLLDDGSVRPDFDTKLAEIKAYAEKAFARACRLGGKIAVFGASQARDIREGISREQAEAQLIRVLRACGDIASKYGMKVALEPIRYQEANFVNTVKEGIEICKRADHPSVGLLIDFFHFYMNGEPIESISEAREYIIHVHMARPDPDRRCPSEEDVDACRVWADALRSIGYDDRVSLECSFKEDFETDIEKARCVTDMFGNNINGGICNVRS